MFTVQYRRWSPPKSPIRVEFPAEVLHQVRAETLKDHDRGFLYGLRQHHQEVRLLAARRTPHVNDPLLGGLSVVGVYISRARGEVFLTDADLEYMEQHQAALALVVAGSRAGFFAREPDGSLQAVRSYEEFSMTDAAQRSGPPPRETGVGRPERHSALPPRNPIRWAATMAGLLVVPVAALAYLRPLLSQPAIELDLRQVSGQLVIGWNPRAVAQGGRLDIVDQGNHRFVPVSQGTSSATYAVAGRGDLEVRLVTGSSEGSAHWTGVRFVQSAAPPRFKESEAEVAGQVAALEGEARALRKSIAARTARVAELKHQAEQILQH